jgi:CubicO group peptidase (beta-lactamase class C family)/Tol biopolymer transport system component
MDGVRRLAVVAMVVGSLVACEARPTVGPSSAASAPTPSGTLAPTPTSQGIHPVDADVAARLDEALAAGRAELGAPGAQAAVVFADGAIWTGADGQSTPDRPMSSDLLMAIASVSKVYTSTLVLKLVDEGVLGLDDPIRSWLPGAPNTAGVTIRQLLTHTSGLASDDPALPPVCDPGTCYSYSNAGYELLGQLIETATGGSYALAMHGRVTGPLGIDATYYPREEQVAGEEAIGHQGGEDVSAVNAAAYSDGPGWLGASGGIVATAGDLARFAHGLANGGILSDAGLAALTDTTVTLSLLGSAECRAGAMVERRSTPSGVTWAHGGNAGSFRAWLAHYEETGLTVAVLTNSNALGLPIADRLAAVALEGALGADAAGHCEDAIAVRAPDGAVRRLTETPGFEGMPAISPDGRSIAWLAFHDEQADLFVAAADGSGATNVTDDAAQDVRASWSPDSSRLVFASNRDGDFELYVLHADDGSVVQLTHNDVDDWVAAWSPDGRSIAYVRTVGTNELRLIGADGTGDREVAGVQPGAWWPAWSPGSDRIAYESGGMIFVVPAAGGEPTRLAVERLRVVRFPTWAPSADIAFEADNDLWAVAPDGSNLRRLTTVTTEEVTPAWGPDGSLAFQVSSWVDGNP